MIRVSLLFLLMLSSGLRAEQVIDAYVSDIVTIGEWENDQQKGQFRFVTKTYGSEHVSSKLYIQWLTYHMDGESNSKIVAEAEVKELNTQYYSFTSPECVGDWKCQSFKLPATHSFTYKKYNFSITTQGLGKYAISE